MAKGANARRIAAWGLVAAQLALLAGLVLWPGHRQWSTGGWALGAATVMLLSAGAVGLAGAARLGRALSALPLPSPSASLRTSGIYRCVRHPIYAALLLGGAGLVLLGGRTSRAVLWLILLALLLGKIRWEERELAARFPDYAQYARDTPRLIPNPARCLRSRHAARRDRPKVRGLRR
jgi:protein-S-isoprenylcysteine O-methyltransferase Ste14